MKALRKHVEKQNPSRIRVTKALKGEAGGSSGGVLEFLEDRV